jgi:hypothetical protein
MGQPRKQAREQQSFLLRRKLLDILSKRFRQNRFHPETIRQPLPTRDKKEENQGDTLKRAHQTAVELPGRGE